MFTNKTVLVTGGTGSFGQTFIQLLLKKYRPKKLIIFSRDEYKQYWMAKKLKKYQSILRFFLGDVRDLNRLERAFSGVDIVIHAAALKQVPALEYNPFEAVKTNIVGSQNVIDAAINATVSKVLLISSDKAVHPINLYGATKLCAEKLFIASNAYATGKPLFSAVRYGNVLGSRGSIAENLHDDGVKTIEITDGEMTRFWISLDQAFTLVKFALKVMVGGEIIVPQIPSMKLKDLLQALAPHASKTTIGLRPGEKVHEMLIAPEEATRTYLFRNYFIILPDATPNGKIYQTYQKTGKKLPPSFSLESHTNKRWLTDKQLLKIAQF